MQKSFRTSRKVGLAAWAVLLMLLGCVTQAADRPAVDAHIEPNVVQLNEPAVLSIVCRSNRDMDPPQIEVDGLQIEYQGSTTQMSFVNGVSDHTRIHQYTVWPKRTGTFEIGPFSYDYKGSTVEIPGVTLQVAGGEGEAAAVNLDESIRAELKVARPRLYVMEDFVIELAVYSQGVDLAPNVQLMGWPETGFRVAEWQEMAGGRELVDGKVWQVRRFRAMARAEYPGKMAITPSIRVLIRSPRPRQRQQDPFAMFGESMFAGTPFDTTPTRPHDVSVAPLNLEILPLPEQDRPASFMGAVGETFQFRAEVTPLEVEAGSPLTLRMNLAGQSSLEGIRAPAVPESEGFRVYEPKPVQAESAPNRRVFEQIIIPKSESDSTIPAIEFSYFNPVTEKYETLSQGPFVVKVKPSTHPAAAVAPGTPTAGPTATATAPKGDDLLYLKLAEKSPSWANGWSRQSMTVRVAAYAIPMILALLGWGIRWGVTHRRNDAEGAQRRMARGASHAGLARAAEAARSGNAPRFYDALASAFSGYVLNRMGLPPGAITGEGLVRELESMHLDPDLLKRLGRLWAECESARYGGVSAEAQDFSARLKEAAQLMKELQRSKIKAVAGGRP